MIFTKLCSWLQMRHYEHNVNLQLWHFKDDFLEHIEQLFWESSGCNWVSFDLWVGHCMIYCIFQCIYNVMGLTKMQKNIYYQI